MNNIAVVITRNYGGVKLGVRGLIDAYSKAAEKIFMTNKIYQYKNSNIYKVLCDYSKYNEIEKMLKRTNGWYIINTEFRENVNFEIALEEDKIEENLNILEDKSIEISFKKNAEMKFAINI